MAKDINIGGRLHSIATGNVVAGTDEILDDNLGKKQTQINTETYSLVESVNNALDALNHDQQEALGVAAKANANEAKLGYYVCDTDADVAAKTVAATNYVLGTGGSIKVKMTNDNTVNNATLNINSTGAKPLFYEGVRASSTNTWKAGETVEVYYDGTNFCANNVAGGGGDGVFDVSEKYPTSGVEGGNTYTLDGALAVLNANLPASKKKGGMSIKFVQSSDNKYVQYRLMANSFTTDVTKWAIADEGVYVENPEFIYVKTDAENKILWGIKTDGDIFYGTGVPSQIINYINDKIAELSLDEYEDIVEFLNGLEEEDKTLQQLLNEKANVTEVVAALENKVTAVPGKQLSTNDFTNYEKEIVDRQSFVNNPEYLEVVNDNNGRAIEATRAKDGKKVLFGGLIIQETDLSMTDNPEFIDVVKDSDGRIVEATRKDGTKYISKIESPTIDKINQRIDNVEDSLLNKDFIKRVSAQLENASVLGWTPQQVWNTPDYYPVDNITPLVFLHISDTHGGPTKKEQIENAVTCLNILSTGEPNRGLCSKFLFHTGDIKSSEAQDDFTYFSDAVENANMPVFLTPGNHDVGNLSLLVSHTMDNSQIYNQMIAPFIERWNLKTDGGGNPHPDGKNYYFTDFTAEKVRLVSLYEYDSDYELDPKDDTKILYKRGYRSFSQTQLDWFANSLLTTPAGYGVIVAKHAPENKTGNTDTPFNSFYWRNKSTQQTYVDVNIIADIVSAFMSGGTINQSYEQTGGIVTTLIADYNFTTKNTGVEFICYISGHTHCDRISFLADYPNQLELNIGCDNVHYTWGSDMNQRKDALSNDHINAYCIDRNKGVVNIVRIGANISNQMQRRDFCSINYRVG